MSGFYSEFMKGGNSSTHNVYFADGNGNVTYMLNSSQTMVASYRYDPFGNTVSKTGSLSDANVYRFSSKEIHLNTGMYYYGFRFYDPNLQRWINRDPLGEEADVNLYRYSYNDAMDYFDRDGLDVAAPPSAPSRPPTTRPPVRPPARIPIGPTVPTPTGPTVRPPRLPPIAGPLATAYFCGWLGATAIDVGSTIIWPEPSPGPLPFNFPTTTCFLSPVSPAGVCLYICKHTDNPDENTYVRRKPGPNGCPDVITVRNPYK